MKFAALAVFLAFPCQIWSQTSFQLPADFSVCETSLSGDRFEFGSSCHHAGAEGTFARARRRGETIFLVSADDGVLAQGRLLRGGRVEVQDAAGDFLGRISVERPDILGCREIYSVESADGATGVFDNPYCQNRSSELIQDGRGIVSLTVDMPLEGHDRLQGEVRVLEAGAMDARLLAFFAAYNASRANDFRVSGGGPFTGR